MVSIKKLEIEIQELFKRKEYSNVIFEITSETEEKDRSAFLCNLLGLSRIANQNRRDKDALALAISSQNNFTVKDFAKTHPGGAIGKRLMVTVAKIMIKKNIPLVTGSSKFSQLLEKTTKSNLGLAIIVDDKKKLIGVISDGDIKRIMKENKSFTSIQIKTVMTKKPIIVSPTMLAAEALTVLEDNDINALPVMDKNKVVGILTLKDVIKSIN